MSVTVIPIMYRDAANYKEHATYILDGSISTDQIEQLRSYLDSGEYFIPQQIGQDHIGSGMTSFPDHDDHCWHEMDLDQIQVVDEDQTVVGATYNLGSVDDFLTLMHGCSGKWDEVRYAIDA